MELTIMDSGVCRRLKENIVAGKVKWKVEVLKSCQHRAGYA